MSLGSSRYFVCLRCGSGDLSIMEDVGHPYLVEFVEGEMQCNGCRKTYPVINGIPRFVSVDNYAGSFGLQWNRHRTAQLDSHTGLPISRNRLFEVTGWPERMEGETILEAGSGAGRFTEILLGTGAEVFSFDYSSAVEANRLNNGHNPNLHLFQGDIFRIPLRKEAFDRVICLGVLQHTPDPKKAFESLVRYVRPGGELVVDVYTKRFLSLLGWKYLLRPVTKLVEKELLYRIVSRGSSRSYHSLNSYGGLREGRVPGFFRSSSIRTSSFLPNSTGSGRFLTLSTCILLLTITHSHSELLRDGSVMRDLRMW